MELTTFRLCIYMVSVSYAGISAVASTAWRAVDDIPHVSAHISHRILATLFVEGCLVHMTNDKAGSGTRELSC